MIVLSEPETPCTRRCPDAYQQILEKYPSYLSEKTDEFFDTLNKFEDDNADFENFPVQTHYTSLKFGKTYELLDSINRRVKEVLKVSE